MKCGNCSFFDLDGNHYGRCEASTKTFRITDEGVEFDHRQVRRTDTCFWISAGDVAGRIIDRLTREVRTMEGYGKVCANCEYFSLGNGRTGSCRMQDEADVHASYACSSFSKKRFRPSQTKTYMDILSEIANANFDGHFTVMKFTTNCRVCFGTVESRREISRMPVGKTFEEAALAAIMKWEMGAFPSERSEIPFLENPNG